MFYVLGWNWEKIEYKKKLVFVELRLVLKKNPVFKQGFISLKKVLET